MSKKIFLFTMMFGSAVVMHAQSDTTRSGVLDDVVVTANKFPQKQSTTGKVISIISKAQIERSSGRTVAQLLNEQTGITINGALSNLGSNQTLYMRGASSGRTLILVDGVPVSDPSFINNDFDLNLMSLNNVERIEIARGSQSTLYGSDAVAGVVNIITVNNNVTKPVNVKATMAGGSFGTFRGNAQVYGKANKFYYNARYAKLTSKGFSAAYDSTGNKNFDNDSYNGDAASTSVSYQLNNDLSVRSFVQYSKYKTDLDASLFTDEKDYNNTNQIFQTGAGFHYQKNKVSVTGNYQYIENKRGYFNDSLDRPGFTKFSTDDYAGQSHFVDLFSSIQLTNNFTLLQGADHRFNSMNSKFYSLSSFGPFTTAFKDTSLSQSSVYASLFFHDNQDKLNIELGGRLNVHSRYGSNSTFTFNPSYNLSNHFRLFANISTGFKAPTLYQLYSSYGRRDLQPERSKTYEFGAQQQHDMISSRLVYFHRQVEDGIDFNNRTYQYFNIIKQTVSGIEAEVTVKPVNALSITANYSYYATPEEYAQSRVTFKDTIYDYLLRRPRHNLNLTFGYHITNDLFVSTSAKYVGKRFDAGGYQAKDILLDSYFILNAYAEYKFMKYFKVFADAQNITNKKFFEIRGYNAMPFAFNSGITFNW